MNPPLIYVRQPQLSTPKRKMQSEYHSPSRSEQKQSNELKKSTANNEKKEEKGPQKAKPSKYPFEQMTIDEKVDYLISPPKYLPKMSCKVSIGQTHYRGKILEKLDRKITFIETQTRIKHHLEIDQIEAIEVIGF